MRVRVRKMRRRRKRRKRAIRPVRVYQIKMIGERKLSEILRKRKHGNLREEIVDNI